MVRQTKFTELTSLHSITGVCSITRYQHWSPVIFFFVNFCIFSLPYDFKKKKSRKSYAPLRTVKNIRFRRVKRQSTPVVIINNNILVRIVNMDSVTRNIIIVVHRSERKRTRRRFCTDRC